MLIFFIILSTQIFTARTNDKCTQTSQPASYHLMEKCHRSKLGIAAKANYTSLSSCKKLGLDKKALALNFSPREALKELRGNETVDYTCEVLKCAEADGGLSLVNDSRYDHYSIYAQPLPTVNSTCVPATGMFFLQIKKLNYSEAASQCRNMSGVLADVMSDQRTDALAQLLVGSGINLAYVTMRSVNGSTFYGTNGYSLDCTTYRAWAPGHPRRQRKTYDCVLITRHRTWQSTPCKKQYPSICELIPGGPYKKGSIFKSLNKNETVEDNNNN